MENSKIEEIILEFSVVDIILKVIIVPSTNSDVCIILSILSNIILNKVLLLLLILIE